MKGTNGRDCCIKPDMDKNRKVRLFLKGTVCDLFIMILQINGIPPTYAGPFRTLIDSVQRAPQKQYENSITNQDILKESQISYRADGGFSTVESYGVILSCVNGKVSVLKSINDPRLPASKSHSREVEAMDPDKYLELWDNLDRQAMFRMENGPRPKEDIRDEFTVHFYAKVGEKLHEFNVYGISRPEAARYFAVRKIIDNSVNMAGFWNTHHDVAQHMTSPLASEKAN